MLAREEQIKLSAFALQMRIEDVINKLHGSGAAAFDYGLA